MEDDVALSAWSPKYRDVVTPVKAGARNLAFCMTLRPEEWRSCPFAPFPKRRGQEIFLVQGYPNSAKSWAGALCYDIQSVLLMNPIITLTTDFGTCDGFVAEMKGKILGINPHRGSWM